MWQREKSISRRTGQKMSNKRFQLQKCTSLLMGEYFVGSFEFPFRSLKFAALSNMIAEQCYQNSWTVVLLFSELQKTQENTFRSRNKFTPQKIVRILNNRKML
jgi:hypothetical protein